MLNVAQDLHIKRGWPQVEYAQVGLVDGPGNPLSAYYAATFALVALMRTGKRVLVHCHKGQSRSPAVALMYLNTTAQLGWYGWLAMVRERVDVEIPEPHEAHRVAFDWMEWKLIDGILRG